jgi:hypothetical protein
MLYRSGVTAPNLRPPALCAARWLIRSHDRAETPLDSASSIEPTRWVCSHVLGPLGLPPAQTPHLREPPHDQVLTCSFCQCRRSRTACREGQSSWPTTWGERAKWRLSCENVTSHGYPRRGTRNKGTGSAPRQRRRSADDRRGRPAEAVGQSTAGPLCQPVGMMRDRSRVRGDDCARNEAYDRFTGPSLRAGVDGNRPSHRTCAAVGAHLRVRGDDPAARSRS